MDFMEEMESLEMEAIKEVAHKLKKAVDATTIWTFAEGCLLRQLTRVTELALMQMAKEGKKASFDPIIRLQGPSLSSNENKRMSWWKVAMAIADELGIHAEKINIKELVEEEEALDEEEERQRIATLTRAIYEKLLSQKYLLVLENLPHTMTSSELVSVGLPPLNPFSGCRWLISTLSSNICEESRFPSDFVLVSPTNIMVGRRVGWISTVPLFFLELYDVASLFFLKLTPNHEGTSDHNPHDDDRKKILFFMILDCLQYCLLFSHTESIDSDDKQQENVLAYGLQQEELVRYWVADVLITTRVANAFTPTSNKIMQQTLKEEEKKDDASSLFSTAKALLGELLARSLLQRHASPILGDTVTKILSEVYHDLIGPREWTTLHDRLDTLEEWKNSNWVSFNYNRGKAFRGGKDSNILTTLILRGCSQFSFFPDDWIQSMSQLRVLDLSYTPLTSLPSSLSLLTNLRLLSLKGCQHLSSLTPIPPSTSSSSSPLLLPSPLQGLEKLETLDLNGTPLVDIPEEVGARKHCLRYIDLSCPNIKSLPPSLFSHMLCLEELLLNRCNALADPLPSLKAMTNLQVLCLSESQITTLADVAFEHLQRLRLLDLSNNHHLISLPQSLSRAQGLEEIRLQDCINLGDVKAIGGAKLRIFLLSGNNCLTSLPESLLKATSLEEIRLQDCKALKEIHEINSSRLRIFSLSNIPCLTTLPDWLSKAQSLEELHINNCKALKETNMSCSSSLRCFSLSKSPIVELVSLRACQQLETIDLNDLPDLQMLDLSATGLKKIPAEIFKLPKLRCLDLLGVTKLRSFPWKKIQQLPKDFHLNQCSRDGDGTTLGDIHESIKQHGDAEPSKVYIRVGDSRLFRTLDRNAAEKVIKKRSFYVCVSPCSEMVASATRCHQLSQKVWDSALFNDVDAKITTAKRAAAELLLRPHCLDKHVEIKNVKRTPTELRSLLCYAESVFLDGNMFDVTLTDLQNDMPDLKKCQIMRCHNMQGIFSSDTPEDLNHALEKLWVSDLRSVTQVCSIPNLFYHSTDFLKLRYVHLEYCPRLEKVFPWYLKLPNLESLNIKFCGNLKSVFYSTKKPIEIGLQLLQDICLLELPRLQHLHEDQNFRLPALEELKVRGCQSLRRLPLLGQPPPNQHGDQISTAAMSSSVSTTHASHLQVRVSGESSWWNNLAWNDEEHHDCFHFKPQLPIAAIKPGMKKRPLI